MENKNEGYESWYQRIPGRVYTHSIPKSFIDVFGYCNFHEIYAEVVTNSPNNATMVEIGSLAGHSAALMAQLIQSSGKIIDFYSIDPLPDLYGQEAFNYYSQEFDVPMYDLFMRNIKSLNLLPYVTQMRITSERAARLFEDNSVDFIFIDGDHSTEGVILDINTWLPKMKKYSVMAGHDYDHKGVRDAVDSIFKPEQLMFFNTSWIVQLENGIPRINTEKGTA